MGVIKDGKVSGFLPSTEAFAVHYPGYPSSFSRAVETLGGTEGIQKARSQQSNRLELRFRPEDPYSHPAFGDLRPCNNLLLKISKNKSAGGPIGEDRSILCDRTQTSEPKSGSLASTEGIEVQRLENNEQTNLCADIVACIPEAYHFDGMVDYQHVLPVHADAARRKKRNWTELEEARAEKDSLMNPDGDMVMMLVPPLFAPKDVPENLVLRQSVIACSKKSQEGVVQPDWEIDMEPVLAIDFNINEIPKTINWEEYISEGSDQWESQLAVSKLFDERPIWIKHSLAEQLADKGYNLVEHMLRRLLSRVAYYFSSGPFLRFWIKKGYDPRKDPDSRIYQRIDFRVHPSLRSYCDANAANQRKQRWDDICAFRVFPFKCQTSLQLFELADDYIQEEIRKPPSQKNFSNGTGWFSSTMIDNLRHRIAVRFLSVYPKPGAEYLLKAATESFEKSKKRCKKDNSMPDKEEHQPVDTGVIQDEGLDETNSVDNHGEPNSVDDHEEPDNVEDDEDEEIEFENDEEVEEDESYLRSHSYLNMESISRTHLQELFGSFPSIEGGTDKPQDAGTSDEEYQIFEQDSDENFSDDNNY